MKKIAILGSKGYVGSRFVSFLKSKDIEVNELSRQNVDFLDQSNLFWLLKDIKPDYIINAAGYTGKPNVDACEYDKDNCWKQNVDLPKNISKICNDLKIKYVHVSSGCIYSGNKNDLKGFSEEDQPNFSFDIPPCSFYSGTKAEAEKALAKDKNVYICRLRVPFSHNSNQRNYITKLITYNKLLDVQNSLSNLEEFIEACYHLISKDCPTGIYNITNTGYVTTKQVTEIINKYIINKEFSFFKNDEEFYSTTAQTPRSNCVLNNDKLINTGFNIKSVQDSLENAIKNYK
jgi:dTDP-4-dehydrorhamnose reductase